MLEIYPCNHRDEVDPPHLRDNCDCADPDLLRVILDGFVEIMLICMHAVSAKQVRENILSPSIQSPQCSHVVGNVAQCLNEHPQQQGPLTYLRSSLLVCSET